MLVINKKISGILCVVPLVYFIGISLYSLLPEIIEIPTIVKHVAYWINNTVFLFSITLTFSFLIYERLTKLIIRGTSFFLLTLGIFQIVKTLGVSVDKVCWILICPIYILFLLIAYKYVSAKLR